MMQNKIIYHEDWQGSPYLQFIGQLWIKNGHGKLPEISDINIAGEVEAYVNQGRWVADCPDDCGAAMCLSREISYFICADHGPMCNNGKWLKVKFPEEKDEIEKELLLRPAKHPFWAEERNWVPGESIATLKAQGLEMANRRLLKGF